MYHGILIIDKEAGFTSHDVVAKLRGICKQKRIGHTGTLDPDAVGVLPVCLGSATGICDMLADQDKEYEAVLQLGLTTDTQDASGVVISRCEPTVTEAQAEQVIASFTGSYQQIPPMYSALKVNGKKLYELAREGKEIERKAREVTIEKIEIISMTLPEVTMRVVCSKGTYIRTLCHDIGQALSCGGIMKSLKRTRVGSFGINQAIKLDQAEEAMKKDQLHAVMIPIDRMFAQLAAVQVKEQYYKLLLNGNRLYPDQLLPGAGWSKGEQVRVYSHDGCFFGVFGFRERENCLQPVKMFFTQM